MLYIVANFKSHKTGDEARAWLEEIKNLDKTENKTIIICPSYTLLPVFKEFIDKYNLPIKLGAQNVSQFDEGPFTGEENAKQVKEFAEFVLIGHSERRANFNEDENILRQKCDMAIKYDITPIFLVQSESDSIPEGVSVVAYEPLFAIGSGHPDTPENADLVASSLKTQDKYEIIYGGSVTAENVKSFTSKENINGVLVGGASLNAQEFIKIVQNA